MTFNIATIAQGCHITVNIKVHGHTLVQLTDNDNASINLQHNLTYRLEWFVIAGSNTATAQIAATVTPNNSGFPPLNITKQYTAGDQDGNVFLFTLN